MVADWLQAALDKGGEHDLAHVLDEIKAGRAFLFAGERSAVVVEVHGLVLHFWLAGGELAEIVSIVVGVEAFGRGHGFQMTTIKGRKGWQRVLRSRGYVPRDGYLVKELQCH